MIGIQTLLVVPLGVLSGDPKSGVYYFWYILPLENPSFVPWSVEGGKRENGTKKSETILLGLRGVTTSVEEEKSFYYLPLTYMNHITTLIFSNKITLRWNCLYIFYIDLHITFINFLLAPSYFQVILQK